MKHEEQKVYNKNETFAPEYIPAMPWDKMPVNISYIFEDEKPTGKHGFLQP
jgi:hypothetical protein